MHTVFINMAISQLVESDVISDCREAVFQICGTLLEFFFWLPFSLYRVLLIKYVKTFNQTIGHVLSPLSSTIVGDLQSAHNNTLMFSAQLEGLISLQRITQLFESKVLNAKIGETIRYPQLKQYPINYGGHWFWKADPGFDIKSHIYEWNIEQTTIDVKNHSKLHQNIVNRPWIEKKSPWELILIRDQIKQISYLFLRIYHCMAGAESFIQLLVERLGEKELKRPETQKIGLWSYLLLPIRYIKMILICTKNAKQIKNHPWNPLTQSYPGDTPKTWNVLTQPISMSKLKTIATLNNVNKSSVIMSITSGAVAKLYGTSFLVDKINFLYAEEKPDHPPTMANHVLMNSLDFPMANISPTIRLRACNAEHNIMKDKYFPKCIGMSLTQLGSWILGIRQRGLVRPKAQCVVGISNITAGEDEFSIGGHKCTNLAPSLNLRFGTLGVAFMTLEYGTSLQITVIASSVVMSEEEAQALSHAVKEEFKQLCEENGLG